MQVRASLCFSMIIADLSQISGRTYPARRRTQNLVGGASPIQATNFSMGNVTLEPTSPASVSTVRTSSTAAFSCLPPQRTIAYTRELSLCLVRAVLWVRARTASTPIRTHWISAIRGARLP